MAIQTTTRRASQIADYVKRQFGDESGVQVTDTDLLRWINDGQMEIASVNKILRAKASTDIVRGQDTYDFPIAKVISIDGIHVNGQSVEYMQFPDIDKYIMQRDPKREQRGQPTHWYDYGNQVTFWPIPDGNEEAGITIFYIREPDPVENIGDLLNIPDRYYNSLVRYVLAQAYEMDEDWQAARQKNDQFNADLTDLADEEVQLSSKAYPTITFL